MLEKCAFFLDVCGFPPIQEAIHPTPFCETHQFHLVEAAGAAAAAARGQLSPQGRPPLCGDEAKCVEASCLHPHTHTQLSDCVSLSGLDGAMRSVKHPSDLCAKSVTRDHLFWTQWLAAPSQHNTSYSYVGDRGGCRGTAEEEEERRRRRGHQLEIMKQSVTEV